MNKCIFCSHHRSRARTFADAIRRTVSQRPISFYADRLQTHGSRTSIAADARLGDNIRCTPRSVARDSSLATTFSRRQKHSSTGPTQRTSLEEYHYNVGIATRALMDGIPLFFEQGFTRTDIYDKNIVLKGPRYLLLPSHGFFNTISRGSSRHSMKRPLGETNIMPLDPRAMRIIGKSKYIFVLTMLRYLVKVFYTDISFDIVYMKQLRNDVGDDDYGSDSTHGSMMDVKSSTQVNYSAAHEHSQSQDANGSYDHDDERKLCLLVRFIFEATPRSSHLLSTLTMGNVPISRSVYEGTFLYRFNPEGRIAEHQIENIVPTPPCLSTVAKMCGWGARPDVAGFPMFSALLHVAKLSMKVPVTEDHKLHMRKLDAKEELVVVPSKVKDSSNNRKQ